MVLPSTADKLLQFSSGCCYFITYGCKMVHLKIMEIIRYPIVCSKWMSSTEAVTQEHPACLSAEFRHIITANDRHHNMRVSCTKRLRQERQCFFYLFEYSSQICPCFLTRQAGCGVHPLQQLSHTQLPTVVGVTRQHDLTHLQLSEVSVSFLTPLDGDGALDHVRFIFRCHCSATHRKCNVLWNGISSMIH